jgi:hypothetical protein
MPAIQCDTINPLKLKYNKSILLSIFVPTEYRNDSKCT